MSRKTGFVVGAILAALLGGLATAFELSINGLTLALGITGVLAYVFGEAKADIAKIGAQLHRFRDPKFWLAFLSAAVTILGTVGTIPPALADSIIGMLTIIIGVLFKNDPRLSQA